MKRVPSQVFSGALIITCLSRNHLRQGEKNLTGLEKIVLGALIMLGIVLFTASRQKKLMIQGKHSDGFYLGNGNYTNTAFTLK
jgi:hypothetical protein